MLTRQYRDAVQDKVIRPQKARKGKTFDEWVTVDSELWQKKAMVQIRQYQKLECQDGGAMDESNECWHNIEIFPFVDNYFDQKTHEYRQWVVGAVCFEKYQDGAVEISFCWIHPFWRSKGLLKKHWASFKSKFGTFYVSAPRSNSMQGFLKSVGYIEPTP